MTKLDTNKTLSGDAQLVSGSIGFIFYKYLDEVCFWTYFHRVILLKQDDDISFENEIDTEEMYIKSLKKNVIVVTKDKPDIGKIIQLKLNRGEACSSERMPKKLYRRSYLILRLVNIFRLYK